MNYSPKEKDKNFYFVVMELGFERSLNSEIEYRKEQIAKDKNKNIYKFQFSQEEIFSFLKRSIKFLFDLKLNRIIHNDIKPDNILLNYCFFMVKFIDFDCSYKFNEEKIKVIEQKYKSYSNNNQNEKLSDLLSIGAITYELLYEEKVDLDSNLKIELPTKRKVDPILKDFLLSVLNYKINSFQDINEKFFLVMKNSSKEYTKAFDLSVFNEEEENEEESLSESIEERCFSNIEKKKKNK